MQNAFGVVSHTQGVVTPTTPPATPVFLYCCRTGPDTIR